jgi:Ni,Fe-hydrogenase I cytochrome b subunit
MDVDFLMTSIPASDDRTASPSAGIIQPAWVRVVHWINALAMIVMIMSGWQIYNASPLFDFTFSRSITLGGWLAGGLLWHFAAMWLLVVNGLVYLVLGLATGRFRRKLWPITPSGVAADTKAALTGKLSHDDLSMYNQVQKLLYAAIILVGIVCALCAFRLHGADRGVSRRACRARAAGAKKPARNGCRPLARIPSAAPGFAIKIRANN